MQGQQKLIDDILSSARRTAASMAEEASNEQAAALEALKAELDRKREIERAQSEVLSQSAYDGRVKLGELEAGKAILRAKQQCVAAVYDGVKAKILSAPDGEYLKIIGDIILSECEDGDTVIAAKADSKRVTSAFVKKLSEKAKVKLVLGKEYGDFSGGVILRNDRFDKDLTIDAIIDDLKERTLSQVLKELGL